MAKSSPLLALLLLLSIALTSHPATAQECSADDQECSADRSVNEPQGESSDDTEEDECADTDERCTFWASSGECVNNPNYMHIYCPVSCDTCPEPFETTSDEQRLIREVTKYGEPQEVEGKDAKATLEIIQKTVDYMKNVVLMGEIDLDEEIVGECTNKESCEFVYCILFVSCADFLGLGTALLLCIYALLTSFAK